MNTLKTVFNKLAKEETKLASHKVDLGIAQDLENQLKSLEVVNNSYNELNKKFEELGLIKNKLFIESTNVSKNYDKQMDLLNKLLVQVEKQSRDLGLNANENPIYKKGLDVYDKSLIKRISIDNLLKDNKLK